MTSKSRVEKVALNNQIVSMRKDVKRARLWLINNLNQRVKKLGGKKGNEKEVEKNKRKLEKLRSEIQLLKHIDLDEVSKFALCNKHETQTQSNDSELDLAQHAMLRLANHKFVQDQVTKFRQTYNVPMDRLILLIRSLGLQYQKRKRKLSLENKFEEDIESKEVDEVIETNQPIEVDEVIETNQPKEAPVKQKTKKPPTLELKGTTTNITNQGVADRISVPTFQDVSKETSKIAVSNAVTKVQSLELKFQTLEQTQLVSNGNESIRTDSESSSANPVTKKAIKCKENVRQKIPWPKISAPPIDKKIGTMEIKQLNLDKIEADMISLEDSNNISNNKHEINELPRDSFFVGGVDLPSDSDGDDEKKDSCHSNRARLNPKKKNFSKNPFPNKDFREMPNKKFSSIDRPPQPSLPTSVPTEEVLHPSWQAKRKEKELHINVSAGGQGKKIRFDDD